MKIKFAAVMLSILMFFAVTSFADLQKETPYKPPLKKEYVKLKKFFNISDAEIERSVTIAQDQDIKDLINQILVYLKYKKLIKHTNKLPPIFLIYSDGDKILPFQGGRYYDIENIILINANKLYTNNIMPNNLPLDAQKTVDFVSLASTICHELMHYEDFFDASLSIDDSDADVLSELNAYKKSEKVIEYFMKMPEAEAEEIISIAQFYLHMQRLEGYFLNMRKNYIKIADAAEIFVNDEKKICEKLGLSKNQFKMLSFHPHIVFNAKNGGHIINAESFFLDLPQRLLFEINILSGTLKIKNSAAEIKKFKEEAAKITMIDRKTFSREAAE